MFVSRFSFIYIHSADIRVQEEVHVVGRIVYDVETSSGPAKLNESGLVLESSRALAMGARVALRFAPDAKVRGAAPGAGGLGFFPGAIVALKGKNGGGGWFLVSEMLSVSI
jgi:DNA polymerase alpha subunit B